jgi:hypothetical protein
MAKPRIREVSEQSGELAIAGDGNPLAKLVFISSQASEKAETDLLHKMIEAMGLKKDEVLIAHLSETITPGLENIQPQIWVALGETIAQTLLATSSPVAELRGLFKPFKGAKLIATFHPADMIKKPDLKKSVWADLQNVAKELGITLPTRK